jgi:simple sugar transport system ATP-binding protein
MDAIKMQDITKRFGDVLANNQINFNLKPAEIHALLGENGAGKTTLMRILYGLYHADSGKIFVNDKLAHISSPKDAIQLGIGMVTQHFTLVPTLTVAENLVLGSAGAAPLNAKKIQAEIAEASHRFGIPVNPAALIRHLSVGERQRVEILKALYRNARVLILDEPTAVLVPQEVDALFESLERLRKEGLSVIFITHKLNEVMTVCDRISVLRDGCMFGTVEKAATTQTELACLMVGRESFGVTRQAERQPGKSLLKIENLCVLDKKGLPALKEISFDVRAGEILGIAGVSGNGQSELSQILAGMLKPTSGKFLVDEQDLTGAEPAQITAAKVGCILEDRHSAVVSDLSVTENVALMHLDQFTKQGVLDRKMMRKEAEKLIAEYQIKASPDDRIRTLSGGNMQKVILARTLSQSPKVVIAAQPTRGLDIGATEYIRSKLLEQRDRGAAVLLISEDLDEIISISDRIAVIYEGCIIGIVPTQTANAAQLGLMMSGSTLKNREVASGTISN